MVGGALTWLGGWLTQRGQSNNRRTEIRRDAYAGLIDGFDELQRLWQAPETLALPGEQKMGTATGIAVGRIQQAYGVVRLVGSDDARAKAEAARSAAWDLSNLLNTPGHKLAKLGATLDSFNAAAREFLHQAESEVAP